MDGLEATKRIRTKESTDKKSKQFAVSNEIDRLTTLSEINVFKGSHQNIVACSANGDDATIQEALQHGTDAFIGKFIILCINFLSLSGSVFL